MEREYSLLAGALKVFDDFSGSSRIDFIYEYNSEKFDVLKSKYKISDIAGNGSEIDKVLNLLKWCSGNVLHNGGITDVEFIPKNSIDILDYSFQKGREFGVYCRLQAIVFTECCLALGIKSRILHCLPYSPYDFDTHVVSIVYIKHFHKWILIDPGNNRYFLDEKDNILSPIEARSRLGNYSFIKCNVPDDNYMTYMAKNLFYFKSLQINTFASDMLSNQEDIYCVPNGFNVLEREVAYCEYAIKNSPAYFAGEWEKALNGFKDRDSFINLNAKDFFLI
ncbi:transglutaminase domain-containing protein [Clostridium polynesiense]|uniref:transglutaminase domain-containing protein n=1 Tax=Clostridium polynesiense TaxID=1325933 RepID=UPI00058F82F6|nr:transglutaminase domain-containing protein [Clostridium polynesiense]